MMKRTRVPSKSQLACLLASSLTIGFANPSIAANLLVDQAAFLAAAGPVTVETFESAPLSGTADSGALPSISFAHFAAASTPAAVKVLGAPYYGHHNTTPGGSRYLAIDTDVACASGHVTLTFDGPIYSIGLFLIGIGHTSLVETRPVEILLDGIEYPIPTTPFDGNRRVGLLSATPFTTLEIHADPVDSFWSIDDVSYVPEPSVQVMAWIGAGLLFVLARIRGRSASIRRAACSPARPTGSMLMATTVAACLLLPTLAGPGFASDGVLEINQTCALQTGCFAGDAAGLPVTIGASGSYRLTSNLAVPDVNTDGIQVSTDNVSIDLAGFEIRGPVVCSGTPLACVPATGTGSGVEVTPLTLAGISVRDGSIRGMGRYGVDLGVQSEVTSLRVRWNYTHGIRVSTGSIVLDNAACENGDYGIFAGSGSTVSGNTVFGNRNDGILAQAGVTISVNTAYKNGRDGIYTVGRSTVSGNTVYENGRDGINARNGSAVQRNTVAENSGFGLNLESWVTYRENTMISNTAGQVTGLGVNMGDNYCFGTGTVSASCP